LNLRTHIEMPQEQDFERAWLAKFSRCLDEIAGQEIRKKVMKGNGKLSSHSSRQEVIGWTKVAMERLESLIDEEKHKRVMTGCACQYPKSALQRMFPCPKSGKPFLARACLFLELYCAH